MKTPPPTPKPRAASSADRDERRVLTPPAGVAEQLAAPEAAWDDATQRHERGEIDDVELKEARRSRSPSRRLERLEDQFKDLSRTSTQTATTANTTALIVAQMKGQLDGQDTVLENIQKMVSQNQIEHTTMTMARIDVSKENAKAQINDQADEKKVARAGALDAKQTRNKLILLIAGSVLSAGAVLELIKWVAGKL